MFRRFLFCLTIAVLLFGVSARFKQGFTQQSSLPAPPPLQISEDDQAATLTLGDGPLRPDQQEPSGVMGYCVTWGPADQSTQARKLITERMVELQPLTPGVAYSAFVQAVDAQGNLGPASPSVTFKSDSTRVDALRKEMTGFFDDFNSAEGACDELKWNVSYSSDNDTMLNGTFINKQFHAHAMVGNQNSYADRNQVVMRPRFVWNVSGRTGKACFDFDGGGRCARDNWYLDLVPSPGMDITGHASLDMTQRMHPGNFIRIHQTTQTVQIEYVKPDGSEESLASADLTWNSTLRLVTNVRRHWILNFSATHADVSIDGVTVVTAKYPNLGYSKVVPLWTEFAYNPTKANNPALLQHFDNIGFDGPASTVETHNYAVSNDGSEFNAPWGNSSLPLTINIPDSLKGATSAKFFYTLECGTNQSYAWSPVDDVVINGIPHSIPEPSSATGLTSDYLVSGINPYAASISIPTSAFRKGKNTVEFHLASCGALNIHVEYYFKAGTAPAYTPTTTTAAGAAVPMLENIGPGVTGITINGIGTPFSVDDWAGTQYSVSGTIPVTAWIENESAVVGTGVNPGISSVDLLIDGQVAATQSITGATPIPQGPVQFMLDTTQLSNGPHTLYIRAWNPTGAESIIDVDGSYCSHENARTDLHLAVSN